MRITLFIPCLTDAFTPRAAVAIVKILEYLGHDVDVPATQTCCGQPMFNAGFHVEAKRLVTRMLDVFDGDATVVTPSGSCAALIRHHAPTLYAAGTPERQRVENLGGRLYEFVEFLVRVERMDLAAHDVRWDGDVTEHFPCHGRGIGLGDETMSLLRGIAGVRLHPLEHRDQCCGFGGTFAVKQPAISGGMLREKVSCIAATGADVVVCNDAGCAMNIAGGCHRAGTPVEVRSFAEILAEGLELLTREEPS
ncbi:MAG: (Fe-S)-binding protein [Phycisphaerales bacterium]|nr:(Fe-S)-binding protein [Phycisphaerae bacterium]NNF42874.1 (Fe-S)-binding protein [Phycisphaerales bacterium]NNM25826.1 (Fe-S)-binding protein [Phycisphaerales bacterium]